MSLLSNNVTNIPLHCNVCPRRPDFSDVSHLLTHVASKGHLSAYYKMKVKGSSDHAAKRVIDNYDEWYEEFNLEDLMRERMSQKDKKRASGGGSTSRRGSAATTTTHSGRSTPASVRGPRSTRLRDNMHLLDPQLGLNRLKNEPMSRSATPASAFTMDAATLHRGFAMPMQPWASQRLPLVPSPSVKQESVDSSISDDDEDEFDPVPWRSSRNPRHNPSVSVASYDDMGIDDLANDSTKLKGVYWPGMDMFDSATPEMRRKRNQKKNVSVLRSLQATSEIVRPRESIFDAEGVLRKEREITGMPDDDSPIEGESDPEPTSPKKKKRVSRRPRPALAEKDVNTSRVLRNRGGQSHHPPFGRKSRTPYLKEEEEDDLPFEPLPPKRRTGLSIHRDNSGPDITFDQPAPMNYLTSSFRHPFHQSPFFSQQQFQGNFAPRTHSRQPSWGQLDGPFRPTASNAPADASFASFGHYLNQTVAQPSNTVHDMHALGPLQYQTGFTPQQFHQTNPPAFQPPTTWDFLGFENDDLGLLNHSGPAFPNSANGEIPAVNPLFFSSTKEDDEATISADGDEH